MGKGGGSSRKNKTSNPPEDEEPKVVYGNLPEVLNFEPFLPGQQEGISQGLDYGFGQTPGMNYNDMYGTLGDITSPMAVPILREPLTETKAALKEGKFQEAMTGLIALDRILNSQGAGTTPKVSDDKSPSSSGGGGLSRSGGGAWHP